MVKLVVSPMTRKLSSIPLTLDGQANGASPEKVRAWKLGTNVEKDVTLESLFHDTTPLFRNLKSVGVLVDGYVAAYLFFPFDLHPFPFGNSASVEVHLRGIESKPSAVCLKSLSLKVGISLSTMAGIVNPPTLGGTARSRRPRRFETISCPLLRSRVL